MPNRKKVTVCLIVCAVLLAGCSRDEDATGAGEAVEGAITIKGSDTMVHLVTAWAEAFMQKRPEVKISVTGGGSGTGIAALLNATTDICASSRDLSGEEKAAAQARSLELKDTIVARDALSIIVHPANPVDELTLEEIERIYTGTVTNWREVGGTDQQIVVTSRESSSGTYLFFLEHVLDKRDYTLDALLLPATSAIVQIVAKSSAAIGYVGIGYAEEAGDDLKTIGVKVSADAPAVMPTAETVLSGAYSISRPLLLIVSQNPSGRVKEFLDFCLSDEGQLIVEEAGYVKVQ